MKKEREERKKYNRQTETREREQIWKGQKEKEYNRQRRKNSKIELKE